MKNVSRGWTAAVVVLAAASMAYSQEITPTGSAVTASTHDGNVPQNAVDNSLSTRWSANGNGQWIQFDLGTTRAIGSVSIAFYNGNLRSSTFDLQVSTCCGVWTTVRSATSSGTTNSEQNFDFPDVNGRFVRYLGHGNSVNMWNSLSEVSIYAAGTAPRPTARPRVTPTPTPTPRARPRVTPTPTATPGGGGTWRRANLTNFTSYPDPNSEECIEYNGCLWAGQFAFVSGKQTEQWVRDHNIAAVHERDANTYRLKNLRLRQGTRQIDVTVYDMCSDSDCSGCCTSNANAGGVGFLIDIEKYTMQRFGSGSGIVDWQCLNCN